MKEKIINLHFDANRFIKDSNKVLLFTGELVLEPLTT